MSCCPSVLKNGLSFSILLMICLFASALCYAERPDNPKLTKLPFSIYLAMENTPVIYGSQVLLVQNHRGSKPEEQEQCYIFIQDLITGMQVAKLGTGFNFVSAYVHGEEMNVFGTVNTNKEWTKDIYRFWSTDLKNWQQELVIAREDEKQHLFNTSVCRDDQGYGLRISSIRPGMEFPIRPITRPCSLGKNRRNPFHRSAGKDILCLPLHSILCSLLLCDIWCFAQLTGRPPVSVCSGFHFICIFSRPLERPQNLGTQPDEISLPRSGCRRRDQQHRCGPV